MEKDGRFEFDFEFEFEFEFEIEIELRISNSVTSKIQQTKISVTFQRFRDLFYLGWSSSILQVRTNMIKVGSKSWLFTCSSNITLNLPLYTVHYVGRLYY